VTSYLLPDRTTPLSDRQRFRWAMLLAIAVHLTVALAVGFNLYSPPPPQPVFSLNLALLQQAGGESEDRLAGAPVTPAAQAASRAAMAASPAVGPVDAERRLYVPGSSADPAGGAEQTQAAQQEQAAQQSADNPALMAQPGELQPSRRSKRLQAEDKTTLEGFYAEKWRLQVQRIGNDYFPSDVKARGLTGRLTLDVAVRSDGTLLSINILKSSGSTLLDNAARRIVMLAAPFDAFPKSLRQRYDILHIVRTWEFDKGNRLRSND